MNMICRMQFHNTPDLWIKAFPRPSDEGHKYDRGHVTVLSGGLASTGAARLATRAALRIGAGLVTLCTPKDALLVNALTSLAVMVREIENPEALSAFIIQRKVKTIVLGPGGGVGSAMKSMVFAALGSKAACILDADALSSFEDDLEALINTIAKRDAPVILTPHEGEFARLFNNKDYLIRSAKIARAQQAARLTGTIMVLKGANTAVSAPDGKTSTTTNAPPFLATAGAGDVLCGMIAGLLAQGMDAFLAASAAVWLHGECANAFGPGLIAEDLSEQLPGLLKRIFAGALKA
jgi:hydroxyethylthiazole kinase-like uncharacterized protein yjeF